MRTQAWSNEGIGLKLKERNPSHENPQWYELDTDDDFDDPDEPDIDPLPTLRHRQIP